jgi:hypothetical protein
MHVIEALGPIANEALALPVPLVYSLMLTVRVPTNEGAATHADTLYC